METLYAQVVLPLALPNTFTYKVPAALQNAIQVGMRVEVQFGKQKIYAALVVALSTHTAQTESNLKSIKSLIDESPIVYPWQFQFWQWISNYYLCHLGEVMHAALPSALKLSSESVFSLNPLSNYDTSILNDSEFVVVEALEIQHELSFKQIQQLLEQKNIYTLLRSLLQKGVIIAQEELNERYKPKTQTFVRLHPSFSTDETSMRAIVESLEKAPKQLELFISFWQISKSQQIEEVAKSQLLERAQASDASLKSLVEKEILETFSKKVARISQPDNIAETNSFSLSDAQKRAFDIIQAHWQQSQSVALLHGVTASGKTQVYIDLIRYHLKEGETALYLLPEISLTAQMIVRLRRVFGNNVGIYHSKFNEQERVEIWQKVYAGEYKLVVGARSALFLPFKKLGIVIVDEEHDPSYKQYEPAPRYHARDTALYLAYMHQAKVVLGSATPSFESYANAQAGKYAYVPLLQRYGAGELPEIELIDTANKAVQQSMQSHFSKELIDALKKCLSEGHQAILFKNRRGYAPIIECEQCNWIPRCKRCDVSLTYHKHSDSLRCHYCQYQIPLPSSCPDCGATHLKILGFGTEKLEDELQLILPDAQIQRLDLDTTTAKDAHYKILKDFQDKKIDILVGTQMVTKGLDFENVTLVGILSADQLLFYPDFRAGERAIQLLLQVSGRAGRQQFPGKVIIQTHQPKHPLFAYVLRNDYLDYMKNELFERQRLLYPPYSRLLQIILKHKKQTVVHEAAAIFTNELKAQTEIPVLGPATPSVAWVRNMYLQEILIKMPRSAGTQQSIKVAVQQIIEKMHAHPKYKSVVVHLDVDPA
ncbi:MAG: primosomal protein N' [Chitinophagales bacterium]|nr:primosomal protein N' [Bacteroidota bacterium]MCB9042996.1 primosomal protein N' [Chitinophagales bacterium]